MRIVGVGVPLAVVSLAVEAGALVFAEFGAPRWVFVIAIGWLWTFGLPTLIATLLSVMLWEGAGLTGFVATTVVLALLFQCACPWVIARGIRRLGSWRFAS